jgi:YfiH family protein
VARIYPFNLEFVTDKQGNPYFASFPFLVDGTVVDGISCGISSRFAGDMSAQNPARTALFGALNLDPSRVFGLTQIHSREVLTVDRNNPPAVPADGMVCGDRSISLCITVADCLPVFLLDTESGMFGLVHSGWKGTGIVLQALGRMRETGTRAEAVAAVLGPCIGSCCYRVDEQRAVAFEKEFGTVATAVTFECMTEGPPPVTRREQGPDGYNWYLDLKAANVRLLAGAGVRNIAVCGDCTFTDTRLGSFRREGPDFTHMAAMIFSLAGK